MIAAAVLARIGRGRHHIAQPVERQPERNVGNRNVARPRPRQEVGDIGIEPSVIAADRPETERVLFPAPLGPTTASVSPVLIFKRVDS
jgi:hypothetical protein